VQGSPIHRGVLPGRGKRGLKLLRTCQETFACGRVQLLLKSLWAVTDLRRQPAVAGVERALQGQELVGRGSARQPFRSGKSERGPCRGAKKEEELSTHGEQP